MRKPARLFLSVLLVSLAGCGPSSSDGAQATNAMVPPAADVAAAPILPPVVPPILPSTPPSLADTSLVPPPPPPQVTVRAQPAPRNPLDLPPSDDAAPGDPFPQEVTSYMVDRDGCDHFRGEEPYDAERRAYLEESIAELCTGADSKLAMLRRRYAAIPSVVAALKGYEDRIEGSDRP